MCDWTPADCACYILADMQQADPSGASTSKGPPPTEDVSAGPAEEDLQLAWEVAETARLGFEQHAGADGVEDEHFGEVHELLGEIGAEMENFAQAISDYEKVLYHAFAGILKQVDSQSMNNKQLPLSRPLNLCQSWRSPTCDGRQKCTSKYQLHLS